jgi:hypothetical protein
LASKRRCDCRLDSAALRNVATRQQFEADYWGTIWGFDSDLHYVAGDGQHFDLDIGPNLKRLARLPRDDQHPPLPSLTIF